MRIFVLTACLICTYSVPAAAALINRGSGMIYDNVLNITWLQDANLAGQLLTWDEAEDWVDSLYFGGFDDWRLPLLDSDLDGTSVDCHLATELDCRDNELGHLFYYGLGGMLGDNLTGDQGLIKNIQFAYWSDAAVPGWSDQFAIYFLFDGGFTVVGPNEFAAVWAVRSGDVGVVPVPGAIWLFGSALLGLSIRKSRKTTSDVGIV